MFSLKKIACKGLKFWFMFCTNICSAVCIAICCTGPSRVNITWWVQNSRKKKKKKPKQFSRPFPRHFRSFQGHLRCCSRCIAVEKYMVTWQNLEFPCNLPSSHGSLRTGRWKLCFVDIFFSLQWDQFMIIQDEETFKKRTKYLDALFFRDKIVIFKRFSMKNHNFQGKMKN